MEKHKNQFENEPKPGYLKSILDEHEEGYDAAVWDCIDAALPRKKKRRFLFWWWAGVFLLSGLAGGYYLWNQASHSQANKMAMHQELPSAYNALESENKGVEKRPEAVASSKPNEQLSPHSAKNRNKKLEEHAESTIHNQEDWKAGSKSKSEVKKRFNQKAGLDKTETVLGLLPKEKEQDETREENWKRNKARKAGRDANKHQPEPVAALAQARKTPYLKSDEVSGYSEIQNSDKNDQRTDNVDTIKKRKRLGSTQKR